MRYWRVIFSKDGRVAAVEPLVGVPGTDWEIVQAPNEEAARRAALGLYNAKKKKLAKERCYSEGRCACGRRQDRVNPRSKTGALAKVCRVCTERGVVHKERYHARVAAGTVGQGMSERDEQARLELGLQRQRERRKELRLETLLEVREAWARMKQLPFGAWLEREIELMTGARREDA